MGETKILLSANPGLSHNEILKILEHYDRITPEAIAAVIMANNERLALHINTCLQNNSQS